MEEVRPEGCRLDSSRRELAHRAGPTTAMAHIAIQEELGGLPVGWMEHSAWNHTEHEDPHTQARSVNFAG